MGYSMAQQPSGFLHDGWVESAVLNHNSGKVLTGSLGRAALVWNTDSGFAIVRLTPGGWLRSVCFSPDGRRVLTTSNEKAAGNSDAESGEDLMRAKHGDDVNAAAINSDGSRALATASATRSEISVSHHGDAPLTYVKEDCLCL